MGDDDGPEESGPRRVLECRRACSVMRQLVLTTRSTYLLSMKTRRANKIVSAQKDLGSPASVDRFKVAASSFTAKALSSKKAAMSVLKREGIVTAKGNLTKHYSAT